MNNIVIPRKASSETRRSGRFEEPEGVLMAERIAIRGQVGKWARGYGVVAVSGWRLAVGSAKVRGDRKPDRMLGIG
jgi:hypothetical protein